MGRNRKQKESDCGRKEFFKDGKCEECPECDAGYEHSETCGYGKGAGVTCQQCRSNNYRAGGDMRCIPCYNCTLYKRHVRYNCRPTGNAECGACLEGYYDPHGGSQGSMLEMCSPCTDTTDHPDCPRLKTEPPEPATVSSGRHPANELAVSPSTGSVLASGSTGLVTPGHLGSPPASTNAYILASISGSFIVPCVIVGLFLFIWWFCQRVGLQNKTSSTSDTSQGSTDGQSLSSGVSEPLLKDDTVVTIDETQPKTESRSKNDSGTERGSRDPLTGTSTRHGDLPTEPPAPYKSNLPGLGDDTSKVEDKPLRATPSLPHVDDQRIPPIPIDDNPVQERTWPRVKAGNDGDEEWGRQRGGQELGGEGGAGGGGGGEGEDREQRGAGDRVNELKPEFQGDDDSGGIGGDDSQPDSIVSNLSQASTIPVRSQVEGNNDSVDGPPPADLLSGVMPPSFPSSAGPAPNVSNLTSCSVAPSTTGTGDTPPVIEPLTMEPEGQPPPPSADQGRQTEPGNGARGITVININYGNGPIFNNVKGDQTITGLPQVDATGGADDVKEARGGDPASLPVPTCQAEEETRVKSMTEPARSSKLPLPVQETAKSA